MHITINSHILFALLIIFYNDFFQSGQLDTSLDISGVMEILIEEKCL